MNYYQLHYPLRAEDLEGTVLFVSRSYLLRCGDGTITPFPALTTTGGTYHGSPQYTFVLEPDCFDDITNRW